MALVDLIHAKWTALGKQVITKEDFYEIEEAILELKTYIDAQIALINAQIILIWAEIVLIWAEIEIAKRIPVGGVCVVIDVTIAFPPDLTLIHVVTTVPTYGTWAEMSTGEALGGATWTMYLRYA